MKTLCIYRNSTGWVVSWRLHSDVKRIIDLFGTADIPSGFTRNATEHIVTTKLTSLNPDTKIVRVQDLQD